MRSKLAAITLSLALVAILASSAFAQYESSYRSKFGIGASVYNPSSYTLTRISSNCIGPTISYNVSFDKQDRPVNIISLGWFSMDGNRARASFLPLAATHIKYFTNKDNSWFVGGGVSISRTHYEEPDYSYTNTTKMEPGFTVMAGRQIGLYYISLRYDKVGVMKIPYTPDADFSGLSLSVGTNFTL